jgi:glutamate formiminotransferase
VIESIPNVSEGRRPEVVAAIAAAIADTRGVLLLDHSADPSHNRSVYTMAGSAASLREAILALFPVALAHIDLRTHRGEHPRIGAVDVVPFVPLGATTMAGCVDLARSVGREIAERFDLPVYLYEEAALRPDRRRLEQIRRGQFEGLASRITRPEWTPDYGPSAPHPTAGAVVVGARMPLIAFNVNLASDRLDIAQAIARAVRESSGGLACVKALGLRLEHLGIVQVSMNLTNFERTSIEAVFDAVVREADRHGVAVRESELIGLLPAAALRNTSAAHLKLTRFSPRQVLENRLRELTGVDGVTSMSDGALIDPHDT